MGRFFAYDENDVPGNTTQCKRGRGRPKKVQTYGNTTTYPQRHPETGTSSHVNM